MAEGIDSAAEVFEKAIDPAPQPQPAPRAPRDESGRFAEAQRPEPMFSVRMVEGDPETGDTADGGEDPRLAGRERDIADGRIDERAERDAADVTADDEADTDEPAEDEAAEDEGPSYEVTIDGEPATVSLNELRSGYIREATFHSRMNKVNEHRQVVDQENARVSQLRDIYIAGLQHLDEDIRGLSPPELDWDKEYEVDPLNARRKQKQYQEIGRKLAEIRQYRAWAIQNGREEHDRQTARYAVDQFTQFVQDHRKLIKDEPSLQRIIGGMRQTALNEGFNEQEVAGVYDRRMLNVLLKAYLYDRGMAVRPQAVIPGKGKALIPGSATPIGNAGRRNVDEAQRRLARTGKMEDAESYFQRLLR